MATVKQLYDLLDRKAPFRTQMDFDNAGFLVGRGDRTVTRVLVALDITPEVIAEAAEKGCQLILAHHPVIWGKLGQVTDESATGRKVLALIEKGIAAICAHTNLDAAEGGVNTALAQRLGLENPVPLETDGVDEAGRPYGIGRVGSLPGGPLSLADFARKAKENLGLTGIRAMDAGVPVHRVAVGGGACGSMLPQVKAMGCDTFLTADLKHDLYLEARDLGINLLEGVIRMGIFFLYMYLISRMKDMRRLFSYHGAGPARRKLILCTAADSLRYHTTTLYEWRNKIEKVIFQADCVVSMRSCHAGRHLCRRNETGVRRRGNPGLLAGTPGNSQRVLL